MRNGKSKNDSNRNRSGNFKGFCTLCGEGGHAVQNKIIGRIVNPGAGYEGKDSGHQIKRYRIFEERGKKTGDNRQKKSGQQRGHDGAAAKLTEDEIADPAEGPG